MRKEEVEEGKRDIHPEGNELNRYHLIQANLSTESRGKNILLSYDRQPHEVFDG